MVFDGPKHAKLDGLAVVFNDNDHDAPSAKNLRWEPPRVSGTPRRKLPMPRAQGLAQHLRNLPKNPSKTHQ